MQMSLSIVRITNPQEKLTSSPNCKVVESSVSTKTIERDMGMMP